MSKDDIAGIFGAILSSILATFGFLLNIGALQFIFSFLAGSFTTYVVQHRLQIESEKRKTKRENAIEMRDTVYGPIFIHVSKILEGIEHVQTRDWAILEPLKEVMTHYLFFTIKEELRSKLSELLNRFEMYQQIRRATELMFQGIIRKEVNETYHLDIGSSEDTPDIVLRIGKIIPVASITLKQTLLQGLMPQDFVRMETQKWGKDLMVEVSIGGVRDKKLSDFEFLHKVVLHEIEKDPLYTDEKKQRTLLIDALKAYLEQIRVFVNLD